MAVFSFIAHVPRFVVALGKEKANSNTKASAINGISVYVVFTDICAKAAPEPGIMIFKLLPAGHGVPPVKTALR
jgi:hypothetical protein